MNNEKITELTQGIVMDSLVFEICQADALNSADKTHMQEASIQEHEPILWELQKKVNQSILALCGIWLNRPAKKVHHVPAGSVDVDNDLVTHDPKTLHVPIIARLMLSKYGHSIDESWMAHLPPHDAETEEVGELLSPAELRIRFFAVSSPDQFKDGWFGWDESGQVAHNPTEPFIQNVTDVVFIFKYYLFKELVTFRLRNELPRLFRGRVVSRFPWDDISFSHHLLGVALGIQSDMERDFYTATETLKLLEDNVS